LALALFHTDSNGSMEIGKQIVDGSAVTETVGWG